MNVPGIVVSLVGLIVVLPVGYMYWFSPEQYAKFLRGQNDIANRRVIFALYKPWFRFLRRNSWLGIWMGRIAFLIIIILLIYLLIGSILGIVKS